MRAPLGLSRISAFVGGAALLAAVALALSSFSNPDFPGWWGLFVLALVGTLLDVRATPLRAQGAVGSISFVTHLSALILFGGFWAALVVLASSLTAQLIWRRPLSKIVFNTSQRILSVLSAFAVYNILGGGIPLALISNGPSPSFEVAARDLAAFIAAVTTYVVVNSVAVSGAVALSSGRSFSAVWRTNTLWVFGYDVAASSLSLFVAWLYSIFDRPEGLTRLGFLAILLPFIAARHIYAKLNSLQGLYDELDDAYVKLELNVREHLAMMVKSIEARDPYTSGHSRRVSALSRAIAIDFALSEELVDEVENAALLHDVGKIHAEFGPLLNKEGKLTPEEWDVMKTHAGKSAELVGLFSRFKGHVQDSVRHHHERWDGLGYPDGVVGEGIPLGARIIMIADTIDAMTTDRPYRKALTFEVVVTELQKYRGTQFDPKLVDCTVSSVSVRRLAATQAPPESDATNRPIVRYRGAPLRSYGSFFAGRRVGAE